MAARGRWLVDGEGEPYNYQRLAAWEFAYDDPRARYMARELDPNSLVPSGPAAWTDYLGTLPWGDFDLTYSGSTPVVSEQMRYLGTAAQQDVSGGDTRHYHGDLIGSTMLLTDEAGGTNFSPANFAYTAFGEPVTADGSGGWRVGQPVSGAPRYAYAGEWGYETWHGSSGPMFLAGANPNLASIRLSHVGFRWYDASIGRFVQRDPIGVRGGINVYLYCDGNPGVDIDPTGLTVIGTDEHIWFKDEWRRNRTPAPRPPKPPKPPLTPAQELAEIERRLNYWAAGCAIAAGVTFWCPPVAGAFCVASGGFWMGGTYVGGLP